MEELFDLLINAYKVKEITDILLRVRDTNRQTDWLPVGNRRNNISTINIGTDPAAGLTERITNAIDAVLEKEWVKQGRPEDILSPRIASEKWFGIPNGRLGNIKDPNKKEIQDVGEYINVTMHESGNADYPSVDVRDYGIGLRTEEFSNTILSLNENNKINKLFLMGAYGQGGSTTISFSTYTLIMSKPFFKNDNEDPEVAWTIVRINEGDINYDKQPWYEYLVDKTTGMPFTTKVTDEKFKPGTLVRHIHMDLGKYTSAMTNLTGSLWYLVHHHLFNSIMPFTISDERIRMTNGVIEKRKVTGNNRRLTHGKYVEYQNFAELTFGDGSLSIYWWVLSVEGTKNPRNRIKQYTKVSQPIIITFNGQKQGYLPNTVIKSDLRLPFLERFLIVEIECDDLDNESKRQLFSSTREATRNTSITDKLRQTVTDTLKADEELVRLDKKRRARYLQTEDNKALDNLRKRLASRINSYLSGSGDGRSVTASETRDTVNNERLPPIPVEDPPTYIDITSNEPVEVTPGKIFYVKFKTDAHHNYINNPDTFIALIFPHNIGSFTGTARLVDGYGIAYFKAREDVEIGLNGDVTLEIRPPRQKSISDSIKVTTVEPKEDVNSNNKGNKKTPNINPHFIDDSSALFKELEWDYNSVAKVDKDRESINIWVSSVNKNLTRLISKAQRYSTEAVNSIKNRYLEHISFYAFLANEKENKLLEIESNSDIDRLEEITNESLKNASETVCGILEDFFQAIVIESSENAE